MGYLCGQHEKGLMIMMHYILITQDPYLVKTFSKNHGTYLKKLSVFSSAEQIDRSLDQESLILYDFAGDRSELERLSALSRVMVLSAAPTLAEGSSLFAQPIKGYANRYISKTHLKQAIKAIENGDIWVYPEFIQAIIQSEKKAASAQEPAAYGHLTKREKEIAQKITSGFSNEEIMNALQITMRTVKNHIKAIFHKTGVNDRLSLARVLR
jgi:DNA-binding NarL/FixJ family response regulator